jgi:tripartite-type tricarboxylate transporter receptor subunit TctC
MTRVSHTLLNAAAAALRRPFGGHLLRALGLAVLPAFAASVALAQPSVEKFYSGQTVRIIVASGPGGGYDTFARLLSRHLGRFVPGHPTFTVQHMPGAGGLRAAGYVANVAPRDGLAFAAVMPSMVTAPLLGLPGANFNPATLRWIGSLNSEVHTCVAWHTTKITTLQEAMEKELIVGVSTGSEVMPTSFNALLGTKMKAVSGYQDGPTVLLAMQRGEVNGRCGWSYSSIASQHPEWVRDKTISILVQLPSRHADLPHIPLAPELAKTEADRQTLDFLFGHFMMARSYVLPPDVPAERLAALRTGFDAMVKDEAVRADFAKAKHELTPISGADLNNWVETISRTPKDVVGRAQKLIAAATR